MAKVTLPGLIPTASQRMVLANSTAIAVNSTVRAQSKTLLISSEGSRARMLVSAAPTLSTGILVCNATTSFWYFDYNGTSALRFQRTTGVAIVQIQGFRYAR